MVVGAAEVNGLPGLWRWRWVRLIGDGFALPRGALGRVVKVDPSRSSNGYIVLVAWSGHWRVGERRRATWVPSQAIRAIEEGE